MTKSPTPADLNELHRDFWEREDAKFEGRCKRHPEALHQPIRIMHKLSAHGLFNHPDFLDETCLHTAMERAANRQSERQSANSSRPRTRYDPIRVAVQREMRKWRRAGHTLPDFLESAAQSGIECVEIEPTGRANRYRIAVYTDDAEHEAQKSIETLRHWWGRVVS
ncbi:hypothetical protein [Salinisphaera orenii]|uniref:hypothetical protein n=1 Tax=Salinisphaera orenii TaxID=856731 RepID=UPI000DBE0ABD